MVLSYFRNVNDVPGLQRSRQRPAPSLPLVDMGLMQAFNPVMDPWLMLLIPLYR